MHLQWDPAATTTPDAQWTFFSRFLVTLVTLITLITLVTSGFGVDS